MKPPRRLSPEPQCLRIRDSLETSVHQHNQRRQSTHHRRHSSTERDELELQVEEIMVASVCDVGAASRCRSRSNRISDDRKRTSRSLSRAVSRTRHRSKSRGAESAYSRLDGGASRGGRNNRLERERAANVHVMDLSASSLQSHEDVRNSHDDSHHGNRGMIASGAKSRAVPPPPPPKNKTSESRTHAPKKLNETHSSLGSHDSTRTENTHPSTSFTSSERELCVALVPLGGNQGQSHYDYGEPLPLPPSPKSKHTRCASRGRGGRNHRSKRSSLEDGSVLDSSGRSETKSIHSRNVGDRRPNGRSKSRTRRSFTIDEDINESSYNGSEEVSVEKSRTSRRSRDMNRVDLRSAQRSLSRGAGIRRQSEGAERPPERRSYDYDDDQIQRQSSTQSSASRRRHPTYKLKESQQSDAPSVARRYEQINAHSNSASRYEQIDAHPHYKGTNTSALDPSSFKDSASFDEACDDLRSRHSKSRGRTHRASPSSEHITPRSKSRPRGREEEHQFETPESRLLSHPAPADSKAEAPVLNLVIDDSTGCGSFVVPTLYESISGSLEKHLQVFSVQLNEPSQEFFIQTSMGLLNRIREIHPKTNILRTLSHWNDLQKRRYCDSDHGHMTKGGQLGISKTEMLNKHEVIMTLVGKYHNRSWEYDEDFHSVLENFVEDALRFHACLNGLDESEIEEAQRKKKKGGLRLKSDGGSLASGSRHPSGSHNEDWMGKKVLCRVLEKITR